MMVAGLSNLPSSLALQGTQASGAALAALRPGARAIETSPARHTCKRVALSESRMRVIRTSGSTSGGRKRDHVSTTELPPTDSGGNSRVGVTITAPPLDSSSTERDFSGARRHQWER
jgi:hypothetical protein